MGCAGAVGNIVKIDKSESYLFLYILQIVKELLSIIFVRRGCESSHFFLIDSNVVIGGLCREKQKTKTKTSV